MVKTIFLINFLILLFIQTIFGQQNQKKWVLEDCIEYAFEHSLEYKNIELSHQKNLVSYNSSISFTRPQLDLRFNTPYSISKNENEVFYSALDQFQFVKSTDQYFNPYLSVSLNQYLPTNGNLSLDMSAYNRRWFSTLREDKNRLTGSAKIQFDQPIFRKNNFYYLKEKAELFTVQSEYDYVKAKNEFVYEVITRFYDLIMLQVRLEMELESLNENNLDHQLIIEMYKSGRKSELDLLNSEVLIESQKLNINMLRTDYKTTLDKFGLLIGYENTNETVFDDDISIIDFKMELKDMIARAQIKNAEILKTELNIKDIDLTIRELSDQNNISVDLNSSLDFDNTRDFIPIETTDNFYQWKVGLNFAFPVLDGGQAAYQTRLALLTRDQIHNNGKLIKNEIIQSIKELTNNISALEKEIEISRRKQKVAEKAYKLAQIRFTEGSLSLREKIESELVYKSSAIGVKETTINLNKKIYQLKKLLGLDLANGYLD